MNFNETLLRAKNFGSGLIALGLQPGPSSLIGIYSQNRPEWIIFEQVRNIDLILFSVLIIILVGSLLLLAGSCSII